jgi:NADPH-dependent 2,4-dienoyl-CoA reductase/sulfur reductase-like enzyme
MVSGLESTSRGTRVILDVGDTVDVDVIVAAIGSTPNTDWLSGSGLDITDGVVCDEFCLAAPGVAAAGDVARWYHPVIGRHVRVEHRMNATEQSHAAVRSLLGHREPFAPVSYFWTDQFDVKIQAYGECRADYVFEVVEGDVDSNQFAGLYTSGERVVGAATWNMPRAARMLRQAVVDGVAVQPQ